MSVFMMFLLLPRMAARAHAGRIGVAVLLVVLLVVVKPVERSPTGAQEAANRSSRPRAVAPTANAPAGRADRCARHGTDRAILPDLRGLIALSILLGGL